MMVDNLPANISLPLLGIGALSLILSLIFCCYMWRLKWKAKRERGYRRVKFVCRKKAANETCPVCLEDFELKEYIAICHCTHCFHMKCLLEWLRHKNMCPMCKAPVQSGCVSERTGLVSMPIPTRNLLTQVNHV